MGSFAVPVIIALAATTVVLIVGVFSMARGGDFDRRHSVELMFARVGFHAITIILVIVAALYAARLA
jgi:hypothetical protein